MGQRFLVYGNNWIEIEYDCRSGIGGGGGGPSETVCKVAVVVSSAPGPSGFTYRGAESAVRSGEADDKIVGILTHI